MTTHDGAPGRIILLNGTSSSGKSSVAEQLLRVLDTPHFHMSVDAFGAMRATEWARSPEPADVTEILRRTRVGFHRAVAGMAQAGNDIVVDHVLSEPWRLLDCLAVFAPYDVVFVGVHCPPDELERRERARRDRPPGLAAGQLARVHTHGIYDFECDTGAESARDCALRIRDHLIRRSPASAFDRLRAALPTSAGGR